MLKSIRFEWFECLKVVSKGYVQGKQKVHDQILLIEWNPSIGLNRLKLFKLLKHLEPSTYPCSNGIDLDHINKYKLNNNMKKS